MQLIQRLSFIAAALILGAISQPGIAVFTSRDIYATSDCKGTPAFLDMFASTCIPTTTDAVCGVTGVYNLPMISKLTCVTDQYDHAAARFGDTPYVLADQYLDDNCEEYAGFSTAGRANGDCITTSDHTSRKFELDEDGSMRSTVYTDSNKCDDNSNHFIGLYDPSFFERSTCEAGVFGGNFAYRYYSNVNPRPTTSTVAEEFPFGRHHMLRT